MKSDTAPDWVVDDAQQPAAPDVELRSTVVHYSDRPDRCTIYPPEASGVARLSTWLSADRSAFVDPVAMR